MAACPTDKCTPWARKNIILKENNYIGFLFPFCVGVSIFPSCKAKLLEYRLIKSSQGAGNNEYKLVTSPNSIDGVLVGNGIMFFVLKLLCF